MNDNRCLATGSLVFRASDAPIPHGGVWVINMQTNLKGRLRNTTLPLTTGLLPLFEGVVNSIHGIEEAGIAMEHGQISVEILRKPKQSMLDFDPAKKKRGPDASEEITGFKVTDNGVGFNDANMQSFQELDTEHKIAKGCRGIGRLLWLKAFASVHVSSVFEEPKGTFRSRTFRFTAAAGVDQIEEVVLKEGGTVQTKVHLNGFQARYRDSSRKTLAPIAETMLEHCLWYFVRPGSAPKITIWDDGETISLDDLYDAQMHASAVRENLEIKGMPFELIHIKLRSNSLSTHAIAYCADNRLVTEEKIEGKIPGLHGKISDASGDFVYECYVSSPFLDACARPERTGFNISENVDALLSNSELSLNEIRSAVLEQARKHLSVYLSANLERSKERIETFVSTRAPRYRPILSRIPQDSLNIDPDISDKDLDLTLHKHLVEIEGQLLAEGHDIMNPMSSEHQDEYRKRLASYLSKAEDLKRSDLANYVSHRKVILDLLSIAIRRNPDGSYAREDLIHSLIMPLQQTSDDVLFDSCNLWLVDERLAFHDYLASDKTLRSMPITECSETKEPDICALSVYDNPILVSERTNLPLASIVIVEIKRPLRNDARPGEIDDPVEQAIGYLSRIRTGKASTSRGRPIPESDNIPGFCYVIADLTPKLQERCRLHHDLKWTHDKLGFFGYKENCKAYIEVISFDRLVNAAKERNRAFFDKLGLPAN